MPEEVQSAKTQDILQKFGLQNNPTPPTQKMSMKDWLEGK
jgi:hypothetical protein